MSSSCAELVHALPGRWRYRLRSGAPMAWDRLERELQASLPAGQWHWRLNRRCSSLLHQLQSHPEREIAVAWGDVNRPDAVYPLDLQIEAADRAALLRDIGEVFARERTNVVGVKTQSVRDRHGSSAHMTFTVEVPSTQRLGAVLKALLEVQGVRVARRR